MDLQALPGGLRQKRHRQTAIWRIRSRLSCRTKARVKADQGTVAYDQVQLSYCHIVSPITGRVGLRLVDPGNTVFAGSSSTLVVITQLQPITVVFNVSEDDLAQVQTQLQGGRTLRGGCFRPRQ